MTDAENTAPATDPMFIQLIASLSATALQQLGKLVNPATGKAETHLEGARFSIDMVETLERKTRGQLSDEEQRLVSETLTLLRLNYVETAASAPAQPPPSAGEAAPQDTPKDAPKTETAAKKDETPPRYHKSYG